MALAALQRIPASHPQTFAILISGYMMQGIGFGVSACFIMVSQYRAIRYGFHRGASAASGFLACGPFGYTALVLLRLGDLGRNMWDLSHIDPSRSLLKSFFFLIQSTPLHAADHSCCRRHVLRGHPGSPLPSRFKHLLLHLQLRTVGVSIAITLSAI